MADEQLIKPRELPAVSVVYADDAIMVDDGVIVGKATPGQIVDAGAPVASEAEAIAGTDNTKRITPLNLKQVLDDTTAPAVTRAQAWAESPDMPDPALPDSKSAKTWAGEAENSADDALNYADMASRYATESPQSWDDFALFDGYADGKVVLFNGVQFERDTAADIPGLPAGAGWRPFGAISPEHFGAIGDGVADDTQPLRDAFSWAGASGTKLVSLGDIYRTTGSIDHEGSIDADMTASEVFADFSGVPFILKDFEPAGPYALTEDYTPGSASIKVSGLPAPLGEGKRIRLFSLACDPANRETGDDQAYRTAEFAYTTTGSTGDEIVLSAPLRFTEGVWSAARVPAYTIDRGARVYVMADASDVNFQSPLIRRPIDIANLGRAISVMYHAYPKIQANVANGHGGGVYLGGTDCAMVFAPKIRNLTDNSGAGALGYGVSDAGHRTQVFGGGVVRSRHGYTTSESTTSTAPLVGSIMTTGRIVGATLIGFSTAAGTTAGIDTHSGSEGAVMVAPTTLGSSSGGIGLRGRGVRLIAPVADNCERGVQLFSEQNDGAWLAGDLRSDYTSAYISDATVSARTALLVVTAADGVLSGTGLWRTGDSRAIQLQSGSLTFTGTHKLVIDGSLPRANCGAIDISVAAVAPATPFTTGDVIVEGTLEIDASQVTSASFYGARILTNGRLIVRGVLRLIVPAGASIIGGGGRITCEGNGVIEFAQPGTTGIPESLTTRDVRAVNLLDQSTMGTRWGVSAATALPVNNQMGFEVVSNTVLRVKLRGSDGVTRSTTLTLT